MKTSWAIPSSAPPNAAVSLAWGIHAIRLVRRIECSQTRSQGLSALKGHATTPAKSAPPKLAGFVSRSVVFEIEVERIGYADPDFPMTAPEYRWRALSPGDYS